ncbi:MAG: Uma2 family endonuclease [Merismopedia sp. SIO2A8]|nr:Uma2 family endonuclease [Merismopedia sp. SIO2A8]
MVQHPSNAPTTPSQLPVLPLKTPSQDIQNHAPKWDNWGDEWLSDEPELESDFHRDQIDLLLHLMRWYWRQRSDVYFSGNTTVYFDPDQRTNRNFRGPDIYVVFGAEKRRRNSWMVWREGDKYPDVVIELLSDSTAKTDRTTKKDLYQDDWQVQNYFWFHPETKEFRGFTLVQGKYQAIQPNSQGHLWSDAMELFMGIHSDDMLRLFTNTGQLVPTEAEETRSLQETAQQQERIAQQQMEQERSLKEQAQDLAEQERQRAEQERQRAEQERQRAEQERQRAEQLAARLRQMGLDPEDF